MLYVIVFFTSLVITIFSTPYFIRIFTKLGIVDRPDQRKIHNQLTPRMGGLIIAIVVFLSLLLNVGDINLVRLLLLSLFIILVTGIIDDVYGLKWSVKFYLQIFSVLLLLLNNYPQYDSLELFFIEFNGIWSYIVLFFFLLGVINSINLMDGMDGLVSGYGLLVLSFILLLMYARLDSVVAIISVSALGALLGFLKFNASPARIFLGDTGSLFLGLLLGYIMVRISLKFSPDGSSLDLTPGVMILAVPIIDTVKVLFVRLFNGQNPFLPDKTHLHHIIFGEDIKQKNTVFLILLLGCLFLFSALVYLFYSQIGGVISFFWLTISLLTIKVTLPTVIGFKDRFLDMINKIPGNLSFNLRMVEVFYYVSFIAIILFVIDLLLSSKKISDDLLLIIAGFYLLLTFVAIVNYKSSGTANSVYVFLNLLGFCLINGLSVEFLIVGGSLAGFWSYILLASVLSTLIFIFLYVLIYRNEKTGNSVYINGLDLILIVFVGFVFTSTSFFVQFPLPGLQQNAAFILLSYIWYKTAINFRPSVTKFLYFLSYLLIPLSAILIL